MQQLTSEVDMRIVKLIKGIRSPRKRSKVYAAVDKKILESLNRYEVEIIKL
jgi:hypothetical protein